MNAIETATDIIIMTAVIGEIVGTAPESTDLVTETAAIIEAIGAIGAATIETPATIIAIGTGTGAVTAGTSDIMTASGIATGTIAAITSKSGGTGPMIVTITMIAATVTTRPGTIVTTEASPTVGTIIIADTATATHRRASSTNIGITARAT